MIDDRFWILPLSLLGILLHEGFQITNRTLDHLGYELLPVYSLHLPSKHVAGWYKYRCIQYMKWFAYIPVLIFNQSMNCIRESWNSLRSIEIIDLWVFCRRKGHVFFFITSFYSVWCIKFWESHWCVYLFSHQRVGQRKTGLRNLRHRCQT